MDSYTTPKFESSALVTIDMQNDFGLANGASPIPGTMPIVPHLVELINAYRKKELPIVHIVRLYLRDGSNAELCRRKVIETGLEFVAPDSEGAELLQALKPNPGVRLDAKRLLAGEFQSLGETESILYKPRWGAFYGTQLNAFLRQHGVDTLVVAGCNFPNCPRSTIYEASERDYRIVAAPDALSQFYAKGEEELRGIGVCLLSTEEIIERLTA
jgi:nicotinamidase-related amidase